MKAYFDTNVLVAFLKHEHVHHEDAFAALARVRTCEIKGCTSAHALSEVYSVLTRAPFETPVHAEEALAMIERSVLPNLEIVELRAATYIAAIRSCAQRGWKGGRVHDAVHIQAAAQAGCDVLYTFDVGHFRSLAPEWGDRIQVPPA